jgi:hypothetical protein
MHNNKVIINTMHSNKHKNKFFFENKTNSIRIIRIYDSITTMLRISQRMQTILRIN